MKRGQKLEQFQHLHYNHLTLLLIYRVCDCLQTDQRPMLGAQISGMLCGIPNDLSSYANKSQ